MLSHAVILFCLFFGVLNKIMLRKSPNRCESSEVSLEELCNFSQIKMNKSNKPHLVELGESSVWSLPHKNFGWGAELWVCEIYLTPLLSDLHYRSRRSEGGDRDEKKKKKWWKVGGRPFSENKAGELGASGEKK